MRGSRRASRGAALVITAALGLAIARPARAESPNGVPDPVAQALFQDGRDLVDKGQWEAGCTKFEASMLLYPAASTLLNIARCHEHQNKLASAWSAYKRAQVLNRETLGEERKRAIADVVEQQIQALTPRLPKIKLEMPTPIVGIAIRKDGEQLPTAVLGTEVPVDAGEHEIIAEAPGYRPFRQKLDVKESTLKVVSIELLREGEWDARDGAGLAPWVWATAGAGVVFAAVSAGFRIDQAYVEGKQAGICGGDVRAGCPPRSVYDPAEDNRRKNLDFGLFVGFGAAGAAALAASIVGAVRGSRPGKAPAIALSVTADGVAAGAAFQF